MIDTYVNDFPESRTKEENRGTGFNKFYVDKSKVGENKESGKDWRNDKPFQNKSSEGKERVENKTGESFDPAAGDAGCQGIFAARVEKIRTLENPKTALSKRYIL